jgi:hypothetical protein
VKLLEAHSISSPSARGGNGTGEWAPASRTGSVARRAADAITNLAHENIEIKNMVSIWLGGTAVSMLSALPQLPSRRPQLPVYHHVCVAEGVSHI